MGQSVPPCQPEDEPADGAGHQRCGLEPVGASAAAGDPVSGSDDRASFDSALSPAALAASQRGIPFIVQAGRELFMVASESSQWVLAELRFDTASCTFVEARRVRYDWPREAFGSLLARVAVGDAVDHDLITRVTSDFSTWLASQFTGAHRA